MRSGIVVGWLVQIGAAALFGVIYDVARLRRESVAVWATIYAVAWWIVGLFAVMPPPLQFAPWSADRDPALFQLAVAGLLAALSFGAALINPSGRARARRSARAAPPESAPGGRRRAPRRARRRR